MASYVLSPLQAVSASGLGALAGFECTCSCGTKIKSSLLTLAQAEASAHANWHERKEGKR